MSNLNLRLLCKTIVVPVAHLEAANLQASHLSLGGMAGRPTVMVEARLADADAPGLLVKPEIAYKQLEAERSQEPSGEPKAGTTEDGEETTGPEPDAGRVPAEVQPKRFHGTVNLDPTRVGRDASRIADEVIAHLSGLVGATVTVTLEVEAEIPSGAPDHVVRTVTENSRTLKFTSQGFEKE